jgi:hypothetical protein
MSSSSALNAKGQGPPSKPRRRTTFVANVTAGRIFEEDASPGLLAMRKIMKPIPMGSVEEIETD